MPDIVKIDNCPVCDTTCELEFGLEDLGDENEREIAYATCKTCKTRWRRIDDPKVLSKMIYEMWTCRIPELSIQFPFIGGGFRLPQRWCRWKKMKERHIPVGFENGLQPQREEKSAKEERAFDETIYPSEFVSTHFMILDFLKVTRSKVKYLLMRLWMSGFLMR